MIYRLKRNNEFRMVYRHGKSIANNILVLYVFKNRNNKDKDSTSYNKIGISVSKKVGNSVVRSRCKRLITESYRIKVNDLKTGYDCIFVARTNIKGKDYNQVNRAVDSLLKKAGLYKL
ncbi:MAG: ribonuclease P protein component [Clostridium sp.]|jgi:ribonuclease P protein component|nr:ribonuclease P protein component [Clostridium sp.]